MDGERESIWSVRKDDLAWYSILFPSFWVIGVVYHGAFVVKWHLKAYAVSSFLMDSGAIGISSAVLAMMVVAGKRVVMALFDWPSKREKREAEAVDKALDAVRRVTPSEELEKINRLIAEARKIVDQGGHHATRS